MHVGMCELLREHNDLATAEQHLQTATELGQQAGPPQNAYRSRVALARIRQAQGDLAGSRVLHERAVVSGQLQTALNGRIAVEQAKGMLAEQADLGMGEAFELLRRHARHHNRRLRDVVAEVINRDLSADQLHVSPSERSVTEV